MAQATPLAEAAILEALSGVEYTHYEHPSFDTCAKSSAWHQAHKQPGRRVKNLFLRNKNGKQHFLLMLPHEIDFDKAIFKAHSNQKCGMASDDRLWQFLKIKPGAVSPLSLIHDEQHEVQVYVEKTLLDASHIHLHAGFPTSSICLGPQRLIKLLEAWGYTPHIIDWTAPTPSD